MENDSGVSLSSDMADLTSNELPKEQKRSLEASEFISFAMYKLWHPKTISRRATVSSTSITHKENPALPVPYNTIVSPPGQDAWYPYFVLQTHKVLSRTGLPTPLIFISLIYIARLRQNIPAEIGMGNEFKLLLASLIVSQKQNSDYRYANSVWATITGYSVEAINKLEKDFLTGMKWNLHVKDQQYEKWVATMQSLRKEHALVLKAYSMDLNDLQKLELKLAARPDLLTEIVEIRRAKTIN